MVKMVATEKAAVDWGLCCNAVAVSVPKEQLLEPVVHNIPVDFGWHDEPLAELVQLPTALFAGGKDASHGVGGACCARQHPIQTRRRP